MNRPASPRQARTPGARVLRRRTAEGAAKAVLLCLALTAAALAAGLWRATALSSLRAAVPAVRADAADGSRAAVAEYVPAPEAAGGTEPGAGRPGESGRFRLEPHIAAFLDSIAAQRDTELVLCLRDPGTVVVPRQSVVAPLGVRLQEDCPSESFALWHNHPASAVARHAACSLSTMDVGIVLRMQPRWAIVQAQRGERCWWSYGQVVQHALISREPLAPVDTQFGGIPGI